MSCDQRINSYIKEQTRETENAGTTGVNEYVAKNGDFRLKAYFYLIFSVTARIYSNFYWFFSLTAGAVRLLIQRKVVARQMANRFSHQTALLDRSGHSRRKTSIVSWIIYLLRVTQSLSPSFSIRRNQSAYTNNLDSARSSARWLQSRRK